MKHITKILALALALIMVLGLATSVSAATIEIVDSESGASREGHTYKVYQIFTGTYAEIDGENILGEVAFGQNYAPADTTIEQAMAELQAMSGAEAAAFLKDKVTGEPVATLSKDNNWKAENLADGYYLIIDVSEDLPETEEASALILEVRGNTAIKSKHEATPTTYKKVDDINDSTGDGAEIEWHDSADHDIGDLIDFQLNAVLPSSFDSFKGKAAYPFTFHDVESDGLEFQADTLKAYIVDGQTKTEIAANQYVITEDPTCEEGCTFHVAFADLTQVAAAKGGAKLVVEYKSELTEDAVIGEAGNPNKMRGEFNRRYDSDEPEFTPWDTVIVFTFKAEVNKVDPELKPLTGAEFKLQKFILNEEGTEEYKGLKGTWETLQAVKNDEGTTFSFAGIDDGYYRIVETKAPAGYNKIDDIYFTVTAEHEIEAAEPKLTALNATAVKADGSSYTEAELASGKVASFTVTKADGAMATTVVNEKGVELPSTGGIGTTIFYIIGGLLAVAAVVLLVTKKRMASAE